MKDAEIRLYFLVPMLLRENTYALRIAPASLPTQERGNEDALTPNLHRRLSLPKIL